MRNKFSGLTKLVFEHVNILIIAETKLDTSFPTAQFLMPGFHKPFRLDVITSSGGLLVCVKRSLPARELEAYKLQFNIQPIHFEINLRNGK